MPSNDENRNLVSMAQEFTGLPMDSLIGAPLNAAANANAAMAVTQTKFMLDTCFSKETNGSSSSSSSTTSSSSGSNDNVSYKPIMIKMSLTRGVLTPTDSGTTDIQEVTTTFDLPILTIIPINSLGVDNVDVNFEMEVKSSFSEENSVDKEKSIQASASWEVKVGWGPVSASVKGTASYDSKDSEHHSTHYQASNSAKYTVNVHAGQLPVPKGVNTIIQAYTNAIQPITMPVGHDTSSSSSSSSST